MALPDISGLSSEELQDLLSEVGRAYQAKESAAASDAAARRASIQSAIESLTALLGVADGTPDTESIRGVLQYDDATMAANSGLALRLAFTGLEQITATVLNMAHVMSNDR